VRRRGTPTDQALDHQAQLEVVNGAVGAEFARHGRALPHLRAISISR
jgi:hypothetical protein